MSFRRLKFKPKPIVNAIRQTKVPTKDCVTSSSIAAADNAVPSRITEEEISSPLSLRPRSDETNSATHGARESSVIRFAGKSNSALVLEAAVGEDCLNVAAKASVEPPERVWPKPNTDYKRTVVAPTCCATIINDEVSCMRGESYLKSGVASPMGVVSSTFIGAGDASTLINPSCVTSVDNSVSRAGIAMNGNVKHSARFSRRFYKPVLAAAGCRRKHSETVTPKDAPLSRDNMSSEVNSIVDQKTNINNAPDIVPPAMDEPSPKSEVNSAPVQMESGEPVYNMNPVSALSENVCRNVESGVVKVARRTNCLARPNPCIREAKTWPSVQGSDSEDEPQRLSESEQSAPEVESSLNVTHVKRIPRPPGSSYARLCFETMQKFTEKFGNKEPVRNQLTMLDLIFYNPKRNPMQQKLNGSPVKKKDFNFIKTPNNGGLEDTLAEQSVDDVEPLEESSSLPVPQLKVGPDGNIILDPDSLVIERTGVEKSRMDLENSEVIFDTGMSYGHYNKRRHRRHDWSKEDTVRFYRALCTLGTDFTLMQTLFPKRTRRELKLKFKREERSNYSLLTKVMNNPCTFDIKTLKEKLAKEDEEKQQIALRKQQELDEKKQKKIEARRMLHNKKTKKPKKRPRGSFCASQLDEEDTGVYRIRLKQKRMKIEKPLGQKSLIEHGRKVKQKRNAKRPLEPGYSQDHKKKPTKPDIAVTSKETKQEYTPESGEDEENYLSKIIQPTRSGRKPKLKQLNSNLFVKSPSRTHPIDTTQVLCSSSSNVAKKKSEEISSVKIKRMPVNTKTKIVPLPSINTLPCIKSIYPNSKEPLIQQETYGEPLNLSLRFGEPSSEGDLDDNISIVSGLDSFIVRDMVSMEVPALEDFTHTVEQMNTSLNSTTMSLVEPVQLNKLNSLLRYSSFMKTAVGETRPQSANQQYKSHIADHNEQHAENRSVDPGIDNYNSEIYLESDIMRICNASELDNPDFIIPHYLIEEIPRTAYECPERSSTPYPSSQQQYNTTCIQEEEEEIVVMNLERFWPEATVVSSKPQIESDVPVYEVEIITGDIEDNEQNSDIQVTDNR